MNVTYTYRSLCCPHLSAHTVAMGTKAPVFHLLSGFSPNFKRKKKVINSKFTFLETGPQEKCQTKLPGGLGCILDGSCLCLRAGFKTEGCFQTMPHQYLPSKFHAAYLTCAHRHRADPASTTPGATSICHTTQLPCSLLHTAQIQPFKQHRGQY